MAKPVDNHNDNALDTSVNFAPGAVVIPIVWGPTGPDNFPVGGTVAEVNGRIEMSPAAGVAGISSLDTAIDDSNSDFIFKLVDIDDANMVNGNQFVAGFERSNSTRYAYVNLYKAGGNIVVEYLYVGSTGYGGTAPAVIPYNPTAHVWFKLRQLSANNNDVEWSVAPEGSTPTTPGAWTVIRKLSIEASWAAHIGSTTPTLFSPVREGIWAYRSGGSGWTPKFDNFNFTEAGVAVRRPVVTWFDL